MNETLDLADYRRRVADLYAAVRSSLDPARAWAIWRTGRDALLASHSQSPVPPDQRGGFRESPFFGYDPALRVLADVDPVDEQIALIDNSGDGATRFVRFGVARTEIHREPVALDLYWLDSYGGGLFLPFRDLSSGTLTYGGGRYLLDEPRAPTSHARRRSGARLQLQLSPVVCLGRPVVVSSRPAGQRIPIEIKAGERLSA